MADNKYISAIEEIKLGIKSIIADMELADKKILQLATSASKIGDSFKTNTPDGLNNALKEQTYLLKLLSAELESQRKNTDRLGDAKKKLIVLTGQEKINNRELARNADLYAQSTSKLVGAYGNLIAKQKIAKKALQDLISAEKQNVSQIKRAQAEYDKYTNRVNQANRATSNFAKNSLGGAVRGFRNLIGAFGIVGGVTMFANVTKDVFNLTKRLQSLQFALKTVTDDSVEYARVQNFLSDISNRYGANILTTTERYTKFLAAAKQSNVELKDTEKIFESVTKAAGVLGLKTDELNGVYLALEQMLSKGKVTTEELRRQLGERLPGAFGIMANALEVPVSKLDEMLRKGEVLSYEALPKFADAVEKAYGIEQITKINTLVAAQNRLSNSWVLLVDSLTGGSGEGGVVVGLFNLITDAVSRTSKVIEFIKKSFDNFSTAINVVGSNMLKLLKSLGITEGQVKSLLKPITILWKILTAPGGFVWAQQLEKLGKNMAGLSQVAVSLVEKLKQFTLLDFTNPLSMLRSISEIASGMGDAFKVGYDSVDQQQKMEKANKILAERNDLIDRTSRLMSTLSQNNKGNLSIEQASLLLQDKSTDAIKKYREELLKKIQEGSPTEEDTPKGGSIDAKEGSIAFQENYIKTLEDERQKVATTAQKYAEYTRQIEEAEKALFKLRANFENNKVEGQTFGINTEMFDESNKTLMDEMVDNANESMEELEKNEEDKRKRRELLEEQHRQRLDNIIKTTFDTFSQYYDIDLEKFEFLYDGKKNKLEDWMSAADELIDAALDASLNRYDIELQEAQRSRDLIVNNELATEKEKRLAREKFELEERRIKTERAKAERTNTLVQISVDTARGAVLAYLSQLIPGDPTSIPRAITAAAVTTGFGLAQAALVASQPIPRFAEGTKAPLAKDTLAIVGDGGRKEAITENGKLLGVTPDKPTLMSLKKGQEVQKDAHSWIDNAVYRMNMESNGEMLSSVMMDNIMHDEMKKMRAESKRTWEEVKKLASRPINVSNRVIVESKMNEYKQ